MSCIKTALPEWIEECVKTGTIREGSAQVYRSGTRTWTLPAIGRLRVNQVTREQVGAIILEIKKAKRSKSIMLHMLNPLRTMFEHLVETKKIPASPCDNLRYFTKGFGKRKEIEIFTREEIARIKAAAEATRPRYVAFIQFALGTGCRWGECAAVTWDDIDFQHKKISITKSWSRNAHKLEQTKTSERRTIPLTSALAKVLRKWETVRKAEGLGDLRLVFPGTDNRHEVSWGTLWRDLLVTAKVKHRGFKTFRNCFASYNLQARVRPELVQRWLGHATLSMTIDIYGQFIPDADGDARDAEKLGALVDC